MCELGWETRKLGKDLVDKTNFGSKVVLMNIECKKATNVAYKLLSIPTPVLSG